nr:hypothetical protein [Tanacetum cinerariifolium]
MFPLKLTRSNDQILPFAAWVPIGKSNYVLDLQKKQKNPIFHISVDILQNTNFFRAFTVSASILAIYIQQFWNTLTYEAKTGTYGEAIIDFVNELGYTEVIHFMSRMAAIYTFLTDKANLGSPTKNGRKDKPYIIPYCRFMKLIICHVGRIHNIHQISSSLFHLAEEDFRLGNLKFVSKGEADEYDQKVATEKEGKMKTASAKRPKSKLAIEKSSKPAPAPKPKPTKERPSKAFTAKPPKPKPAKEKSTKTTPPQQAVKGKIAKVRKVKSPFQLVDEPDEEPTQSEPEPELEHQGESDKDDMERAIQMKATQPLPVVEGKGKSIVTEKQAAHSLLVMHMPKRISTTDQFIFQRRTPAIEMSLSGPSAQAQVDTSANIVHESPFPDDAETGVASEKTNSGGDTEILQIDEEQGNDVDEQVNLKEKTNELDQGQAGSDPGRTPESRPSPQQVVMDKDQAGPGPEESRGALAGPDPEPTHDKFIADLYPKFINDKSTEDEPKKSNVEAEVVSMVTVLIYQASYSVPPLSTPIPVIDLSPPKPASSTTQGSIFTATTTTTLPPPPQQQSTTESELAARVTSLEKKLFDLEQKNKTLDNTSRNLGSRVFTLELRDLPHKIDEAVCESLKEVVYVALQAPLRDRFRELPEADIKEILHHRMFETGTYKSLPEHMALYEDLETSIERANRDELLTKKDKYRKRRRDDQGPPPPSPDSDLSKRRRHDIGASGSSQPQAPQSSAWKKSDTRDASPSFPKQQSDPHAEQLVEDTPMPDTTNVSDSDDTYSAHLLKLKQRQEWLKPIPDDKRPTTPEPAWVIPTSHIPDAMGKTELTQADFEGQAYEVIKAFYPNVVHLQFQMEECHNMLTYQIDWANPEGDQVRIDISKPLPLSAPPGHVIIQTQFFFDHDLDYLRYGSKGSGKALSISKMKATRYLDFGLELLVPEHMWFNEVCTYDISASYGISHWWFNRQKFYIYRHIADSSCKVVRTHMRILSVVSIKAYSRYGYGYLKEITLRRADYQEYTIAEKDFKILNPNDFEDLNLLLLQGHLNHLSGSDKQTTESYSTEMDEKGVEYKHDYTIIELPRAVVFPVGNNERKIMRFNEIYNSVMHMLRGNVSESSKTIENIRVIPKYHNEDGNPARANIKQALGRWRWCQPVPEKTSSLPHAHT